MGSGLALPHFAAVGVALVFFPEAVVADAKLIGTVMIALGAGVYLTAPARRRPSARA